LTSELLLFKLLSRETGPIARSSTFDSLGRLIYFTVHVHISCSEWRATRDHTHRRIYLLVVKEQNPKKQHVRYSGFAPPSMTNVTVISSLNHLLTLPVILSNSARFFLSALRAFRIRCVAAQLSPSKHHIPSFLSPVPGNASTGCNLGDVGAWKGICCGKTFLGRGKCV
jgi:hypothetical protein